MSHLQCNVVVCCREASLTHLWPVKQPALQGHGTANSAQAAFARRRGHAGLDKPRSHQVAASWQPNSRSKHQGQQRQDPEEPNPKRQNRLRQSWEEAESTGTSSSELQHSEPDSVHTAHFSDEGELSDSENNFTSKHHTSSALNNTKQGLGGRNRGKEGTVVLYHGPSSKEIAAARAASKPPPGRRPPLGDVLLEAIHSDDVRSSANATGAPEEPQSRDKWRCIMRCKGADG